MRLFHRDVSQRTTGTYKSTRTNLTANTLLTSGTDGSLLLPDLSMPSARIKKKKPRRTKNLPNMSMDEELKRVLAVMDETSSRSSSRSASLHKKKSEQRIQTPPRLLSFMRRGSVSTAPPTRPKISKSPSIRDKDRQLQVPTTKKLNGALQRSMGQKQLCPPIGEFDDASLTVCNEIKSTEGRDCDEQDKWLGNVLFVPSKPPLSSITNPHVPIGTKLEGSPRSGRPKPFQSGCTRKQTRQLRRAKVLTYNDCMDGPSLVSYKPACPVLKEEESEASGYARETTAYPPPITVLQAASSTSSISVLEWTEPEAIEGGKTSKQAQKTETAWSSTHLDTPPSPLPACSESSGELTSTCIAMMMMKIQEQSHSSITHDDDDFQYFERTTSTTSGKWDSGGGNDVPIYSITPPKLEVTASSSSIKWKSKKGLQGAIAPPVLESAQSSSSFHTMEWNSYSTYFDTPTSPLKSSQPTLKPTMSGSSELSGSPRQKKASDRMLQKPERTVSPCDRNFVSPRFMSPETLEIAPGRRVPIRGAEETMLYVATEVTSQSTSCMIDTIHCCACTSKIHAVNDAAFILCPVCQTVQPTENACGFGVALGFLPADWEGWKRSLMQP